MLDKKTGCGHHELGVVAGQRGEVGLSAGRPRHRPQPPQRGLAHVRVGVAAQPLERGHVSRQGRGPCRPRANERAGVPRGPGHPVPHLARRDPRQRVKRPRRPAPVAVPVGQRCGPVRERLALRFRIRARPREQPDRDIRHVGVVVVHGAEDRLAAAARAHPAVIRPHRLDPDARIGVLEAGTDHRAGAGARVGVGAVAQRRDDDLPAHPPVLVLEEPGGVRGRELVGVHEGRRGQPPDAGRARGRVGDLRSVRRGIPIHRGRHRRQPGRSGQQVGRKRGLRTPSRKRFDPARQTSHRLAGGRWACPGPFGRGRVSRRTLEALRNGSQAGPDGGPFRLRHGPVLGTRLCQPPEVRRQAAQHDRIILHPDSARERPPNPADLVRARQAGLGTRIHPKDGLRHRHGGHGPDRRVRIVQHGLE